MVLPNAIALLIVADGPPRPTVEAMSVPMILLTNANGINLLVNALAVNQLDIAKISIPTENVCLTFALKNHQANVNSSPVLGTQRLASAIVLQTIQPAAKISLPSGIVNPILASIILLPIASGLTKNNDAIAKSS
jgi:hypothetical protein